MRRMIEANAGRQPGDPAKAAAAMLTALDAPVLRCACRWVTTPSTRFSATSTASADGAAGQRVGDGLPLVA
jgi:hypothetical protein